MIRVAKQKVLSVKKKLKPLLLLKDKYRTTYKDIKKYFNLLNQGLFNNKLTPFNDIEIKNLYRQKCLGQVIELEWKRKGTRIYKLEMDKIFDNKKDFLDTLAHEMVHLYQFTVLKDTGNHNKTFYKFNSKLKLIGLKL
jgi:hypothetical protein